MKNSNGNSKGCSEEVRISAGIVVIDIWYEYGHWTKAEHGIG